MRQQSDASETGQDIYLAAAAHYLATVAVVSDSNLIEILGVVPFTAVLIPLYEVSKNIDLIENLARQTDQPTSPPTFLSVKWGWKGIFEGLKIRFGPQSVAQLQSIEVTMASPVDILVQDFLGRRIGFNPATGTVVNDFGLLGFYSGPGTEPQTIYIGGVLPGAHIVTGIGTGSGPYTLTVTRRDADGNVLETQTTTGVASPNAAIAPLSTTVPGPLPGDLNGDGVVNPADLQILLLDFGKTVEQSACGSPCDLDLDGVITLNDLLILQLPIRSTKNPKT